MRFRKRFFWILLFIYLALGFLIAYYFFELSPTFADAAADHALQHLQPPPPHTASSSSTFFGTAVQHLTDVPLTVWVLLILIFYSQGFCLLLACTKPNPRLFLSTPFIFMTKTTTEKPRERQTV